MRAVELIGDIDDQHRLCGRVPENLPPGPVRLIVLVPDDEDAVDYGWDASIATEWSADLSDARQDIYSLEDGLPVNAGD